MNNPLIYRRKFQPSIEPEEPILFPEHENAIVPDQSPNNPKFYDSHGYMQSDVALLFQAVEQQNNELASSLRNSFSAGGDTSRLDSSLSEDQMFGSTHSRFAQSPTEVQDEAAIISDYLDIDNQSLSSSDDGDKISFSDGDAPASDS